MTSKAWTWRGAIAKSNLEPTTRHVLLTLSLHFNEHGKGAFPNYDTLSQETGLSRKTVIVHIGKAVDAGWLNKVIRRVGAKEYRSNIYEAKTPDDLLRSDELMGVADTPTDNSMGVTDATWGVTDGINGVYELHHNSPINIPDNIPKEKRAREREFNPEVDLSDAYFHEGIRLGINEDAMDYHIAAFIDVYAGKKKKDWLATWRTYCRNAVEWGKKGTKGERGAKASGGTISSILADF